MLGDMMVRTFLECEPGVEGSICLFRGLRVRMGVHTMGADQAEGQIAFNKNSGRVHYSGGWAGQYRGGSAGGQYSHMQYSGDWAGTGGLYNNVPYSGGWVLLYRGSIVRGGQCSGHWGCIGGPVHGGSIGGQYNHVQLSCE